MAETISADLLCRGGSNAETLRGALPGMLAAAAGYASQGDCVRRLAERTVCITMLAGAGTRWVESLKAAQEKGRYTDINLSAPRALFPVANYISARPESIPIAAYALAAVQRLGRHIILVRGWESEIARTVLAPLGYEQGSWQFVTQAAPAGKPRGHGDAAFASMQLWENSSYVIVNFGGDVSSPLTVLSALLAIHALDMELGKAAPGVVIPAALMPHAEYPIALDDAGLPVSFGHAKLSGTEAHASCAARYTNVGMRVYKAAALKKAITELRAAYWTSGTGYALPGNAQGDEYGGEFALDNVDTFLAQKRRARILPVAMPEELSPVKSLADLPRFEKNAKRVWQDAAEFI